MVQLTINLTRGNLELNFPRPKGSREIKTPLSYHLSNLTLIALEAMRLLVLIVTFYLTKTGKIYHSSHTLTGLKNL